MNLLLEKMPDDVKSICGIVWTADVKSAYKALLIAQKAES